MALLKLLYVALAQSATDWPYHADTVVERLAATQRQRKIRGWPSFADGLQRGERILRMSPMGQTANCVTT